jgi:Kef-type K+ transport system membrane component KefB
MIWFLYYFPAVFAAAYLGGRGAARLGLPKVVGELVAGILLGPTALGHLWPGFGAWLGTAPAGLLPLRAFFLEICALFLLFSVGLETNLGNIRREKRTILLIGASGFLLPFLSGAASVLLWPQLWEYEGGNRPWLLPAFVGTALSISALPVIARILRDLGMLKSRLGAIILSTATLDDVVGWLLFAVLVSGFQSRETAELPLSFLGVPALFLVVLAYGTGAGKKIAGWSAQKAGRETPFLLLTLLLIASLSFLSQQLGVHAILGAFLAGIIFSAETPHRAHRKMVRLGDRYLSPFYFASVGIGVDFARHTDLTLALLVLGIATFGKVGGAWLGGRLAGLGRREALIVGWGMNARGAVGIILVTSAYQAGVIGERIFAALLVMAMATTLLSGPLMKRCLRERAQSE